jgi:hypothetical protein
MNKIRWNGQNAVGSTGNPLRSTFELEDRIKENLLKFRRLD